MFNWKTNSDRKILEAIPAAVYMIDADRRIRFWSRGAQEMTGCTSESLTGELYSTRAMNYVDSEGETLQVHQYPAMQCLKKGEPVSGNFLLYSCSNGKLVVEESCAPLYEKGRITGVVGIIKNLDRCSDTIRQELRDEKKDRLITICGWCKMIRVADKSWSNLEHYLTEDGFGVFTHSMCPSCAEKIFEKKVYLESYQNLCQSISSGITVDEVLKLIVSNVVNVMNVKASSLRLLSRDKQSLELAAYHGLSEKYANKGPVAYDASVDDAEAGKPVSLYDITEHTDSRYYKEAIEEGIRSILSIPLRYENSTIGVLRMYTSEPVKYTDEDMKFMSAIANQAAIAINNADHFEKAVSKEKEYLRVFEDITKTVSSSLNVEEVLQMIVRKMPEVLGLKAASLRLINKEEKQLELAAFWGLSDRYANKGPVAYDFSIQDALAGKPVSEYDINDHKDSIYYREQVQEGIRSILSIPMRFQDEIIGVLRLYSAKPEKYKEDDLDFICAVAEQTAIAIVNAKHFENEISREKEYLAVFREVTRAVSSSLNVREILDMIVKRIPEIMNVTAATIRLLEPGGRRLKLVASYGLSRKYLDKGPIDTDKIVIEALKDQPVAIYDVASDKRVQYRKEAAEEGIKSMLTLPVLSRGKVLGILRLLNNEHRKFTHQEIDFIASLAEQSGIAIDNATMYEKIKKEYDEAMNYLDNPDLDREQ